MSLTADRIALADQAALRTFAQCSVAWQSIPHWDVGDPGRVHVGNEVRFDTAHPEAPFAMDAVEVERERVPFAVTVAQATASVADGLLSAVMTRAVTLAQQVDTAVLKAMATAANVGQQNLTLTGPPGAAALLAGLLAGRQLQEDAGFRAPACLVASSTYFAALNQYVDQQFIIGGLLVASAVNSVQRVGQINGENDRMLLLGRTREIPHACAPDASAGDEPVDLAVCVPPSIEVIGDNADGTIALALRMRFAVRVKDPRGIVVYKKP